ncbi:hypothetical protein D3C87_79980 [compost metagenome]
MTIYVSFYDDISKECKEIFKQINERHFLQYHFYGWYQHNIKECIDKVYKDKKLLTPFKFYYPTPLSLPQNWCDSMRIIEDDISTKSLICLYCRNNFFKSSNRLYSRRHKLCKECKSLLYEEFLLIENKISFDEFILSKRVIKNMDIEGDVK